MHILVHFLIGLLPRFAHGPKGEGLRRPMDQESRLKRRASGFTICGIR